MRTYHQPKRRVDEEPRSVIRWVDNDDGDEISTMSLEEEGEWRRALESC